jgi:hypothetical protein
MSGLSSWPRWVHRDSDGRVMLREVAPGLYVGAEDSPAVLPSNAEAWSLILSFYTTDADVRANKNPMTMVLSRPFTDGDPLPAGFMDHVLPMVRSRLAAGLPVLVHCQAGLSRSASAAYAFLRVIFKLGIDEALQRVRIVPKGHPDHDDFPVPRTLRSAEAWVRRVRPGCGGL